MLVGSRVSDRGAAAKHPALVELVRLPIPDRAYFLLKLRTEFGHHLCEIFKPQAFVPVAKEGQSNHHVWMRKFRRPRRHVLGDERDGKLPPCPRHMRVHRHCALFVFVGHDTEGDPVNLGQRVRHVTLQPVEAHVQQLHVLLVLCRDLLFGIDKVLLHQRILQRNPAKHVDVKVLLLQPADSHFSQHWPQHVFIKVGFVQQDQMRNALQRPRFVALCKDRHQLFDQPHDLGRLLCHWDRLVDGILAVACSCAMVGAEQEVEQEHWVVPPRWRKVQVKLGADWEVQL